MSNNMFSGRHRKSRQINMSLRYLTPLVFATIFIYTIGQVDGFISTNELKGLRTRSVVRLPPSPIVTTTTTFNDYDSTNKANILLRTDIQASIKPKISDVDETVSVGLGSKIASVERSPLFWRGVVLFICIVWSTNFTVCKEIYQAVPSIDPSLYAAIRFSLAAGVLLPQTAELFGKGEGESNVM